MNTNNDIKHREAGQLNAFLDTLTYWERVEFVTAVIRRFKVKRQTFFNWNVWPAAYLRRPKR